LSDRIKEKLVHHLVEGKSGKQGFRMDLLGDRQGVFKDGSRRRKEADFGAKNTSASLPRRLRLLRRFLNSP